MKTMHMTFVACCTFDVVHTWLLDHIASVTDGGLLLAASRISPALRQRVREQLSEAKLPHTLRRIGASHFAFKQPPWPEWVALGLQSPGTVRAQCVRQR